MTHHGQSLVFRLFSSDCRVVVQFKLIASDRFGPLPVWGVRFTTDVRTPTVLLGRYQVAGTRSNAVTYIVEWFDFWSQQHNVVYVLRNIYGMDLDFRIQRVCTTHHHPSSYSTVPGLVPYLLSHHHQHRNRRSVDDTFVVPVCFSFACRVWCPIPCVP